jgi:hypothetical protein
MGLTGLELEFVFQDAFQSLMCSNIPNAISPSQQDYSVIYLLPTGFSYFRKS